MDPKLEELCVWSLANDNFNDDHDDESVDNTQSDHLDHKFIETFWLSVQEKVNLVLEAHGHRPFSVESHHITEYIGGGNERHDPDVTTNADFEIMLLVPNCDPPFTAVLTTLEDVLKGNATLLKIDPWSVKRNGNGYTITCTFNNGTVVQLWPVSSNASFYDICEEDRFR